MMEKDIVNTIIRYLKTIPCCFAWKTHGGLYGTAGIPDIIACVGGQFLAFEVKQPGGKLTKIQGVTIRKINEAGGKACKVTNVEEVRCILSSLEENRK